MDHVAYVRRCACIKIMQAGALLASLSFMALVQTLIEAA